MKIDNFGPTSKIAQKVANFWATFLKKSSPRSLKSRQNGDKSKVDKERYSTPALGGKSRGGGMLQMNDVTNIFGLHCVSHLEI